MGAVVATQPIRPAIPDVVAEHLEEHGFLSLQRRKLALSDELPARRLAEHDARIEAHWDGLLVNRPASVERAREQIAADDPWERASAIRFWLREARPPLDALLALWAETPPEHAPSWREALRGLTAEEVEQAFPAARRAALTAFPQALLVDALGWNAALSSELVAGAARHPDAAVRAALARTAGHALAPEAAAAALRPLLDDADVLVRRRALWSLALADPAAGLERARALARGGQPEPFALRVLGLLGAPEDHARIADAAATESGRPAAFFAFADLGTTEAIEALIRLLALPDAAHQLAVTEALESALGAIPREDAEASATPAEAAARWGEIAPALPRGARVLAGLARPWRGEPADEPGAWRWRAALAKPARGAELRRVVPDGFFDALPASDARPGE
jgi:hypothetical protein